MKGLPTIKGRPGETMPKFDFKKAKEDLEEKHGKLRDVDLMSYAMYPKVAEDFFEFRKTYGPVDKLETRIFLTGPKTGEEFEVTIAKGKTLHVKTMAVAEDLTPNGKREVFFELNGQLRTVFVSDKEAAKVKIILMKILNQCQTSSVTIKLYFFRNSISIQKLIKI